MTTNYFKVACEKGEGFYFFDDRDLAETRMAYELACARASALRLYNPRGLAVSVWDRPRVRGPWDSGAQFIGWTESAA